MKFPLHLGRMRRALESLLIDGKTPAERRMQHQVPVDGQCILLVDDDPAMRLTLCRQLALLGLACMVTTDARQAMRTWQQHPLAYWLVLIDLRLPRTDGFDLARSIRGHSSAGARIPILACTTTPSADADEHCRRAGIDECLTDPLSMPLLRRTLDRWRPAGRVRHLARHA